MTDRTEMLALVERLDAYRTADEWGERRHSICDAAAAALKQMLEEREALADPVAVHANMLRGTIAKPSVANIIHLYGEEAICAGLTRTAAMRELAENAGTELLEDRLREVEAERDRLREALTQAVSDFHLVTLHGELHAMWLAAKEARDAARAALATAGGA